MIRYLKVQQLMHNDVVLEVRDKVWHMGINGQNATGGA